MATLEANPALLYPVSSQPEPKRKVRRGIGSAKGPLAKQEDSPETDAAKRLVKVTRRIKRLKGRYDAKLAAAIERVTVKWEGKREVKLAELKAERVRLLAEIDNDD